MSTTPPNAIIISDSGLPALVAAAIEAERAISEGPPADRLSHDASGGGGALFPWPSAAALASVQTEAVTSQARFFRFDLMDALDLRFGGISPKPDFLDTISLLAGLEVAKDLKCSRLIWPVQFHADESNLTGRLDRIAAAVDRALLVSRLGLLEGWETTDEIAIETPLVDLTDRQIADLAVDLDVPAYLCWWWRRHGPPEVESAATRERQEWLVTLEQAGWVQTAPGVEVTTRRATARPTD